MSMVTSNGFVNSIGKDFSPLFAVINPTNTATLTQIIEAKGVIGANNTLIQKTLKELSKTGTSGGKTEGAEAGAAEKSNKTTVKNAMEIFAKVAKVSGTAKAMNSAVYDDEVHDRIAEVKEDINTNVLNGTYSETDPRKMKGLTKFAKNTVPVADKLTEEELDLAIQKLVTKTDVRLAVNPADIFAVQHNLIGDRATIMLAQGATAAGICIYNYMSPQGINIKLYTEPALEAGHYFLYDMDKVEYHELRPVHVEELAKDGDYDRANVIAEVSAIINPDSAVNLVKG